MTTTLAATMLAARLHDIGQPMVLEQVPTPVPRAGDVLVRVAACGVVPNLSNVLTHWLRRLPRLPQQRFAELPQLHVPRLFRLRPGLAAPVRRLPAWRHV